jgi:hypothetical protein
MVDMSIHPRQSKLDPRDSSPLSCQEKRSPRPHYAIVIALPTRNPAEIQTRKYQSQPLNVLRIFPSFGRRAVTYALSYPQIQ